MDEKCIKCHDLGVKCIPPLLQMDLSSLANWCRDLKEHRGLTYDELSDRSGVSKSSIRRFFAAEMGTSKAEYDTIHLIVHALIGCRLDELPCCLRDTDREELRDAQERIELQENVIKKMHGQMQDTQEDCRQRVASLEAQVKEKDKTIKAWERRATFWRIVVFILCALIITVLLIDFLNTNIGFYRG